MLKKQENLSSQLRAYLPFLLVVMFPCVVAFPCKAEFSALHFDTYKKAENNLPTDKIYHVTQDTDGFIWVSTFSGLRRFDGVKFESLSDLMGEDYSALLDVHIKQLYLDSQGNMWIATIYNGVFKYNKRTGRMDHYNERNQNEFSLSKGFVRWIVEDKNEHIWIATNNGLNMFDLQSGLMIQHSLEKLGIKDKSISSFEYSAYDNNIWVGTTNGIYIFDSKASRLKPMLDGDFKGIADESISSIHYDGDKTLWIGIIDYGLYGYDYETDKLTMVKSVSNYTSDYIYTITNDEAGRVWVGTVNELYVVDMQSKELLWLFPTSNKRSIKNTVYNVFIQGGEHIWIATESSGLWKGNLNNLSMSVLAKRKSSNITEKNVHTHVIYEDQQKNIWKADSLSGVDVYDNELTFLFHINIGDLIGDKKLYNVYGITQDLNKNMWLETKSALIQYNINSKKTSVISFNDFPGKKAYFDGMIHILLDSMKRLWVFSLEHWLFYKDLTTGDFIFFNQSDGIEDRLVNGIFEADDQSIWLATSRGLLKYDEQTRKFKKIMIRVNSLSDPVIQSIGELPKGVLWLGLNTGLIKYDITTGATTLYTKKDGLSSNNIFAVLSDDEHIWLATSNGLNRLQYKTGVIDTFYKEDGLPDNEFSNRFTGTGYYKSRSGRLYFPTPKGVVYFNPKDLIKNEQPPKIHFTHMKIKGQPIYAENTVDSYLKQSLTQTRQLEFDYKVKDFELGFAALDYHNPKRNQYKYKLIGYDEDWRVTDYTKPIATYGNLRPGQYTLHIKASNHHGVWNEEGRRLRITILPPPWQTWWAYCFYVLVCIFSVYGFYQWRTRQIRQRALLLEQQVEEKTREIMQQNNELASQKAELEKQKDKLQEKNQHINELIAAKDQIFANISHELKTPLTLITGPLKAITKRAREQQEAEELNMIQRNAYRLLRMVDQLLELSKLQQTRRSVENDAGLASYVPLHNIIKSTIPFRHTAADKGIEFEIKENVEALVYCQQEYLEKVILNLVSNAVKYTLEGNIEISSKWCDNKTIVIKVKDTGIGIPEDKIHSIFDRFTRVHDVENQRKVIAGAGIGLSLVKELVESLSGRIEVKSRLGKGSEFTVYLPAVKPGAPGVNYNPVYLESVENISVEIGVLSEEMQHELGPHGHESCDTRCPAMDESEAASDYSILIIDDNADIRHYVSSIFKANYQVLTAQDGTEGIAIAEREIPDLIISDVMMPEQDGFHVCEHLKIKEMTCHIPIILLTALHDQDNRLRGLKKHADAYMTKPFDPEELKVQVDNLLSLRAMMKHQAFNQFIISESCSQEAPLHEIKNPKDLEFLQRFKKVLAENYTDAELNMLHIASKMAISDRQLQRKIKAVTGKKPVEYLRKYRIHKSLELIKAGCTMEQVSYETGFSTRNYFSNCFRAEMGESPTQYQKRYMAKKKVTQ